MSEHTPLPWTAHDDDGTGTLMREVRQVQAHTTLKDIEGCFSEDLFAQAEIAIVRAEAT